MKTYQYDYPRPAVAVDLVLFGIINQKLMLLRGRRAALPHKGRACLPGTYVRETESAEQACERKIHSVGLAYTYLEQLFTFTDPKRDPRERVVTISYYGLIPVPDTIPQGDAKIDRLEWVESITLKRSTWPGDVPKPLLLRGWIKHSYNNPYTRVRRSKSCRRTLSHNDEPHRGHLRKLLINRGL